jgi:hypothetical protein
LYGKRCQLRRLEHIIAAELCFSGLGGSQAIRHSLAILCVLAVFIFSLWVAGQSNYSTKPEISVTMALAKQVFRLGNPMELKIEVTNIGQKAILVPNHLSLFGDEAAHLEIELSNGKALISPHLGLVVDRFPNPSKNQKSPTEKVLGSFVLLPPGTSFVERIALFDYLSVRKYELKAGNYKLKGYYSSGGLFYPPAFQSLELTEEDVKSLPFEAWHGKLATNELSFTILPAASKQ